MSISSDYAQSIVEEMENIIQRNINFMNEAGVIIASIDKTRIGTVHEGALQAVQTKKTVVIKDIDIEKGVKPGINFPVFLNQQVVGVIGVTGQEEEIEPFGKVIKKMTEILLKEAYLEEQTDLEERAKEFFIEEWISANWENDKLFAARGWILGINVHLPRVGVLINLKDFNDLIYNKLKSANANVEGELEIQKYRLTIQKTIEGQLKYEKQDIVIPSGSSKYVVLLTIDPHLDSKIQKEMIVYRLEQIRTKLKEKHGIETSIGIGRYHSEMNGLPKSFNEAKRAAKIASKNNKIEFYDQLGLESFIEEISPESRYDFIERILRIREQPEMEQLLETADVFFRCNQSINETADKLFVHKNTVQYRLKKIKELTGYDPRKFQDGVLLNVALSFYLIES
ncbi:sugar diacid recognition domain-containing protein [Bacillaceae bacterium S4-13-56]